MRDSPTTKSVFTPANGEISAAFEKEGEMKLDRIIAVRNSKTVYRDGTLCLKVFGEEYSKADVLSEALDLARVEETGLHIPRVREVTVLDGKWTIVTDYIKGKTLAQLMREIPDEREKYLQMFVDLQLEVQSKSCPLLPMLKDKMKRMIALTDFDATTRYDLHARLDTMPNHKKLCHGDFNPSNIVIDEAGTPYILDWAHATQGNASADAARTYLLFCLSGDKEMAERYLTLFCEKSGTEPHYVRKWMPIVAAAQSVKGNAHEREFLAAWVGVANYE